MSWLEYQHALKDWLLAPTTEPFDDTALRGDPKRWAAYRRMVRSRFYETIDHAYERLIGVIGRDAFHRLIDRYLAESPPRSVYLRDLPGEFLQFVSSREEELSRDHALPPYATDLMRFEWAELDTAYSHEESPAADVVALDMNAVAVLSPAHRRLDLGYRVHEMGAGGEGAPLERSPVSLCVYRDRATHEVQTLVLTPVAARILTAMAEESSPLTEVVRAAAEAEHAVVDVAFVEALSTLLADLIERGIVLGCRTSTPRA